MEAHIIQRCKNGDLDAFEQVYKRFGNKVFGLCLRMVKNRETAEDLVQEVFVLLLRKINTFRGDAKFGTWLYRIATNTCLSHLRKQNTRRESTDTYETAVQLQQAPEEDLAHRQALKSAIAELPEGYRASVVLHDIQGYTHNEIGEMLGITSGASKSQLFKARRKLREHVATWESSNQVGEATG